MNTLARTGSVLTIALLCSRVALAERRVMGTITDRTGQAASNVRVKAYDSDATSADDLMGQTMTDAAGHYTISYAGGHWDPKIPGSTSWRPDVYIKVSAHVNGYCEAGEFHENTNWVFLGQSGVTSNQRLAEDLTKNLSLSSYPLRAYVEETFVLGENMWCEVNFFFHTNCFACARTGEKLEWSEWGISGVPRTEARCAFLPLPQCSTSDYDRIKQLAGELGKMPLP